MIIDDNRNAILAEYFYNLSNTPIAILDNELQILDMNNAFRIKVFNDKNKENLNVAQSIIIEKIYKESIVRTFHTKKVLCNLKVGINSTKNFYGTMIKRENSIFIIMDENLLTDSEIIANMSELNIEISNIGRELAKKNHELEKANKKIKDLLHTDFLTGIYNRRYFFEKLEDLIELKKQGKYPEIGLLLADIDFFKKFNDTYGHYTGDVVLKELSETINANLDNNDFIARVGGEEFCILLQCENIEKVKNVAEKLRIECEKIKIEGVYISITVSFGATIYKDFETADSFMNRVDMGLYKAKENGRNQVVFVP